MRRAIVLGLTLALALVHPAVGEVVQEDGLRVTFGGELAPHALPRSGSVPVSFGMSGRISTTDGASPPQLRRITVAINRYGHLGVSRMPVCRMGQIQPATTDAALEACGASLVGKGSFSADVLLPGQAPFPSRGEVYAFNGIFKGRPAILAHVYGTKPAPTSYTLPFVITRGGKGIFGTRISASLPQVTAEWGFVTGLSLTLGRSAAGRGQPASFLSASCPAPKGRAGALFPLARTTFGFAHGTTMSATLIRSCEARG